MKSLKLKVYPESGSIGLATSAMSCKIIGFCVVYISLQNRNYEQFKLSILDNLCADVILGTDFQSLHKNIVIEYGGKEPPLTFCAHLKSIKTEPPTPFSNLTPDCKPIAIKSRKYSQEDRIFIEKETQKLLNDGIIEISSSPWRPQPIVVIQPNGKKRMVIDYSQTINRYTLLDAYPLPKINEMINKMAQYNCMYSSVDLTSAYYQIPLNPEDRPYTAYEAGGKLYQFTRLPQRITNGVSSFQRKMDGFIDDNNIKNTFPYLDNVLVCGRTLEEHNANLAKFKAVATENNLTINENKSIYGVRAINVIGYHIENGTVSPDPDRLRPLLELPIPHDTKSLRRVIGMFAYYSKWIKQFSDKIRPLNKAETFPLLDNAISAFNELKQELANVILMSIDENIPFVVETDASDFSISATLSQDGRPVAFHSRTLQSSELSHSSIEKEAQAIVGAIEYWKHFLLGRYFTLITDQKSVSFMFDIKNHGKIKNDKILRWRLALSCYSYNTVYRPGNENNAADTLSRTPCLAINPNHLKDIHDALCHPGITRMIHFVRSKNLPYSVDEIKKICHDCNICAKIKPQYYKPTEASLIKATQPFERLNIDYKGPLPSNSKNKYILTIIDEYSRFPFAYPCRDMTTETVIQCLTQLFSIFGMPSYCHSDRGPSFMSQELRQFLFNHGIATSRITAYNPTGNGQVERYNGIIWNTILLALKTKNLPTQEWEVVLSDPLHSIRSLLWTSTNATTHEKFFSLPRKSSNGKTIPEWLVNPGTVLLKRNVKGSKYESRVDEVELLEANPQYAYIRYPDGRETTVSIKQIAPPGDIGNGHYSTPEIIDHAIPLNTSSEKNISAENITTEATPEPPKIVS